MGIAAEKAQLIVGGLAWDMWSSVSLSLGIERCARSASLSLSAIDPRAQKLLRIVPSLPCEVRIGDDIGQDLLITGVITSDEINAKDGSKFKVKLKSKTHKIIKNCVRHATGVFRKTKFEDIAAALCKPDNINVVCDVDTGAAIPLFVCKPTEKVFAVLDRLSRERGLLFVDDGAGNLHITTVDPDGPIVREIRRGRDYEELSRVRDTEDRYAEVRMRGQTATEIDASGESVDHWMSDGSLLILDADKRASSAECKAQCDWQIATRAGKSVKYGVTVPGWRLDPSDPLSSLWKPNTLARLIDPVWGINADVLVAGVEFTRSTGDGTRTNLTLGSPYGYMTKPPTAKHGKKRRAMVDFFDGDYSGGYEGDGTDGDESEGGSE